MNRKLVIILALVLSGCVATPHKEPISGPTAKITFKKTLSNEMFAGQKVLNVPSSIVYFNLDGKNCIKGKGIIFDKNKVNTSGSVRISANKPIIMQVSFNTNSSFCSAKRAYTFKSQGQYEIQPIKTRESCGFILLSNGQPVQGEKTVEKGLSPACVAG